MPQSKPDLAARRQANGFPCALTTRAVRPTRRLMDSTPRPKHCGTQPKIRQLVLGPAISKKCQCLIGPI
jgi:hypothetical protein